MSTDVPLENTAATAATPPGMQDAPPSSSGNLLAETIFANGLGTNPTGLVVDDEHFNAIEDLLPLRQRMSDVMITAHESVDRQVGEALADFTLAELQALKTQITLREKQLLTTTEHSELFASIDPQEFGVADSAVPVATPAATAQVRASEKLSLLEYAQIREEHTHLSTVVCTRTTADLVQLLRQPDMQRLIPGRRHGATPLAAVTTYVATALRLTNATVDKRITAAASIWPAMRYRRTKLKTPHLASHLERGQIPFASAAAAQEKLADMRQAVRRAGGNEVTADDLVEQQERKFLRHAIRNSSHTFSRYAKHCRDAVTNELVGPKKPLTEEQVKHEKGVFYDGPVGDRLHRLTVILDDAELLQLTAIREFATNLDSATSEMRAQAHQSANATDTHSSLAPDHEHAGDDAPNNPRITPEDIDFGIAQLFDGQTKAERWLNTWLDFTSAGLILHKTYDPHATEAQQRRRDTALQKAAAHSEVLADILAIDAPPDDEPQPTDAVKSDLDDPLAGFIPPGYQLLRPNLDLIVEISLRDLIGDPDDEQVDPAGARAKDHASEISKIVEYLKQQEHGISSPTGSPGKIGFDVGLARLQACHQKIIPMVLGTASQPLDVGRAQRGFPSAIRRALHVRDRGCIVPGCQRPPAWCQPHHLTAWAQGGATSLANAGLVCRHHHGAVHQGLIQIHMEDDGLPSCSLPKNLDPTQTRYRNIYWRS